MHTGDGCVVHAAVVGGCPVSILCVRRDQAAQPPQVRMRDVWVASAVLVYAAPVRAFSILFGVREDWPHTH